MPAEKRRKTEALATVPKRGDPDRKRALNLLAQRRYRQRRRDKIASLEAQVNAQNGSQSHVELDVAPSLETAANSGPSTVSPDDILNVEEHNVSSFDGAVLAFGAVDIDLSLSSDFDIQNQHTSPSVYTISDNLATSPLPLTNTPASSNTFAGPLNLHPVPAQILIPHHPALDTLPWPSIREKLICMLHLPSHHRPPIARGTSGEPIQCIIHDIDDYNFGCRVHGNTAGWSAHHEMAEESWEIGEAFYRNWWFCVDSKIISMTNARRRNRGEAPLSLGDVGSQ